MRVAVGTFTPAQAAGTDVVVTGVGFTPSFGIFMYGGSQVMSDDTGWGSNGWGFGMAGGTDAQAVISQGAHNSIGAWGVNSTSGSIMRTLSGDTGYPPATYGNSQLQSWDTDGFTVYTSATHPYAGPSVSYMVCGGTQIADVALVTQAPTSDVTGFGFDPNFMVSIAHGATNVSMAYSFQADSDEGAGLTMMQYSKGTTSRLAGVSHGRIVTNYPISATYHDAGWLAYGEMGSYISDGYEQNLVNGNIAVQYTLGIQFQDDQSTPFHGTLTPDTDTTEQSTPVPYRPGSLLFLSHSLGAGSGGYGYTKVAVSTDDLAGHYISHGTDDTAGGGDVHFSGVTSTNTTIAVVGSSAGVTASMVLNEINNTDFKWQMSAESTGTVVHYWGFPAPYTTSPTGELLSIGDITGKGIAYNVRGVLTFVSKMPMKIIKPMMSGAIRFARTILGVAGQLIWVISAWVNPKASVKLDPAPSVDDLEVK